MRKLDALGEHVDLFSVTYVKHNHRVCPSLAFELTSRLPPTPVGTDQIPPSPASMKTYVWLFSPGLEDRMSVPRDRVAPYISGSLSIGVGKLGFEAR